MAEKRTATATFKSSSPADTEALAGCFAAELFPGAVLSLEGPIGAGKTFFTKGLAAELGAAAAPVSASFNLMRAYRAGMNIYHFDLFRVPPGGERDIGLEDYLGSPDGVSVMEWGAAAAGMMEHLDRAELRFTLSGGDSRTIRAAARGPRSSELVEKAKRRWAKRK